MIHGAINWVTQLWNETYFYRLESHSLSDPGTSIKRFDVQIQSDVNPFAFNGSVTYTSNTYTQKSIYTHRYRWVCGWSMDRWVGVWMGVSGWITCYDITTGSCLFALGLSLSAITQNRGNGGLRLAFSLSQQCFLMKRIS